MWSRRHCLEVVFGRLRLSLEVMFDSRYELLARVVDSLIGGCSRITYDEGGPDHLFTRSVLSCDIE
jgi:hypothetical protein